MVERDITEVIGADLDAAGVQSDMSDHRTFAVIASGKSRCMIHNQPIPEGDPCIRITVSTVQSKYLCLHCLDIARRACVRAELSGYLKAT